MCSSDSPFHGLKDTVNQEEDIMYIDCNSVVGSRLKRVLAFLSCVPAPKKRKTDANHPTKSIIRGRTLLDAKRRRYCKVLNNGVGEAIE